MIDLLSGLQSRLLLSPRRLATVFALQASLVVLLLAILVPPFENSDEYNHFERADQISRFGLIATRFAGPSSSGGMTDPGINAVDDIIGAVRFHPERKVSETMLRDANAIAWHGGERLNFLNTAVYAPLLYLPSVIGIWTGKLLHLSIVRTLVLSRMATGMSCVLLGSLAIAAAGETALFLLLVLSLPMVLSLFASVSQDGWMLTAAAGCVALVNRIGAMSERAKRVAFVCFCLCLLMLGLGRPAYAPFAVLPLLLPGFSRRARAAGSLFILCGIGGWSLLTMMVTITNGSAARGVAPGTQLAALLTHPGRLAPLAWNTFAGRQGMEGESYLHEMIGVLGWIDTRMPPWFYALSTTMLVSALVVTSAVTRPLLRPRAQGIVALAASIAVILIFLLLYLTWTPVGFPFVDGVQGRYFLPILILVPLFLPRIGSHRLDACLQPLRLLLLAYPTVSMVLTIVAVVRRYYV